MALITSATAVSSGLTGVDGVAVVVAFEGRGLMGEMRT